MSCRSFRQIQVQHIKVIVYMDVLQMVAVCSPIIAQYSLMEIRVSKCVLNPQQLEVIYNIT